MLDLAIARPVTPVASRESSLVTHHTAIPLQLQSSEGALLAAPRTRLLELGSELAIAGFQNAAWQVFIETFETIAQALENAGPDGALHILDCAPSLPQSLRARSCRLAEELEATWQLKAAVENRYRRLTPWQREHANRMLSLFSRR